MADRSTEPHKLTDDEVERLRELVVERARTLSEEDLRRLLADQAKAESKLATVSGLPKLVKHVRLGYAMVRDYVRGDYRKVPWWSVASVAVGLGYFLAPTDMVPDFIPLLGYIDDATVLAAVMTGIREDLKRYAEAKGVELAD